MKQGKTLVELAQELTRIKNEAKDFVAPVEKVEMVVASEALTERPQPAEPNLMVRTESGAQFFRPSDWAHSQIAQYADIPQQYYRRIQSENPQLLAKAVNHGLSRAPKTDARMLRTVGGNLRAFLSSRYRRLDSHDLLDTVLPTLIDHGFEIISSELTERRLYVKAVTPRVQADVKPGDTLQAGIIISSSDVGAGSVRVEPLLYRLVCTNGLITNAAIRKFHIGRDQSEGHVRELLTDETLRITDEAFWAQVRDVVVGSLREDVFQKQVDLLRVAANEPIKNFDIPRVVELSMKAIGITGEKTKQSIIAQLANGADGAGLNKWGLINAVTASAREDHVSYDEAVDIERAASKILELPKSQWSQIAATAA